METPPTRQGTTYGVPSRRKEIASRLSEAYAQDMLDQREFEARLERAEAAGTIEELEALVADFGKDAVPASQAAAVPERTFTLLSDQNHILVPGDQTGLHAVSVLGDVKIDLRAYRGSGKSVTVRVSGFLGDVGIRVPAGTRVVRRSQVVLGEFRHVLAKKPGQVRQLWDRLFGTEDRVPSGSFPADGPPPTLVIEGLRVLGDVTIEEGLP